MRTFALSPPMQTFLDHLILLSRNTSYSYATTHWSRLVVPPPPEQPRERELFERMILPLYVALQDAYRAEGAALTAQQQYQWDPNISTP